MTSYDFTSKAVKSLESLPKNIQQRLIDKIEHYLSQPDPLIFAKKIQQAGPQTYRFQAGDYRVIFDWDPSLVLVLNVGHRKDIYRK